MAARNSRAIRAKWEYVRPEKQKVVLQRRPTENLAYALRPHVPEMSPNRLHLICDTYATHKTPAIHKWPLRHPRFHLHFTPASSSWLNLAERWFAELTSRKLRGSAHRTVTGLEAGVRSWINAWNAGPKPFVWTKTADEIPETLAAYCRRMNSSGQQEPRQR